MNSSILNLILLWSSVYNVDPYVVMNVIKVESSFNTQAIGSKGEIGLMQLLPESFPDYRKEDLFQPYLNIKLGTKYLSECKKKCIHKDQWDFLVCYNAGITGGNKYKYPRKSAYVRKYYEDKSGRFSSNR